MVVVVASAGSTGSTEVESVGRSGREKLKIEPFFGRTK